MTVRGHASEDDARIFWPMRGVVGSISSTRGSDARSAFLPCVVKDVPRIGACAASDGFFAVLSGRDGDKGSCGWRGWYRSRSVFSGACFGDIPEAGGQGAHPVCGDHAPGTSMAAAPCVPCRRRSRAGTGIAPAAVNRCNPTPGRSTVTGGVVAVPWRRARAFRWCHDPGCGMRRR